MRRRPGNARMLVLAALALYLIAALALFWRAPIVGTWDTIDLRDVASRSLGSAAFWLGTRPFGYPLLLKLLGPESPWLPRLQLVLHVAAWALVAWGVARRCRTTWVRVAAFSAIVAGSLSPGIFDWTHVVLTESLSISLLLLPLGLLLVLVPGPPRSRRLRIVVACASGASLLLWIAMRDFDAAWLVVAAVAATILAYTRRAAPSLRRAALAAVAVAVVVWALVSVGVARGQRWRYPMLNVIGRRVLPLPERKARWERAGMPDNAKVRALAGGWAINHTDELDGLEPWLTEHARPTYARELLRDPGWLLLEPLAHWKELLCGNDSELGNARLDTYFSTTRPTAWQQGIARVFLKNWRWLRSELVVALLLVAWAWRRGGLRVDATTAPFILVLATLLPTMVLAWHGDAMEMQRHALLAMVLLRVVLWSALALAVDRLARRGYDANTAVPPSTMDAVTSN